MGDIFVLQRELRGGMSRVFIARETALGRTVVLKVLPPELAATLSVDRFRREIQVAASLQHPHIVPLLSAGQAGDLLYYTMPFIEGESLRERLARQGELPIPSALRILGEVARALSYAHRQGIVHRDIKPENILLTEDDAQVADFGIAKAISVSAGQGTLTSAGVALGTPLYMSPEQAAADPSTDARSDLYSLGVVAYEIFAGQPPFQGRTPAHLMAAHATERPVPLRDRRAAVPAPVADAVMRLLEKRPADRPQTAAELLRELERTEPPAEPAPTARLRSASSTSSAPSATSPSRRGRWLVAGGVATLGLILMIAWPTNRGRPVKVDRAVVAIAPFRVSAADSSLRYLREGMVDLLAAKLGGTAGIRAADPRSLLAAWRRTAGLDGDLPQRDAIGVAERIGAGRLIQGEIVGTREQVTMHAAMLQASDGKVAARASVEGSPDSLPRLVDRLAGKLLALEAGEGEQRLDNLTSTSLSALRAYLEGQALVRRGEFRQAAHKFALALQQDSTFALAGLGLTRAGEWIGEPYDGPGSILAWKHRDKLPPADRALLEVYLGSRWPAPQTVREGIAAAERLVQVAPDNAEAWYELGDHLYHGGPLVGIPDAQRRSARAFNRSLTLDSSFAPALEHGTVLALALGDTGGARKALGRLFRLDSTSRGVADQQWALAIALGDSTARREVLSGSLEGAHMIPIGLSLGLPLQDAEAVLRIKRTQAVTTGEQTVSQFLSYLYNIIIGWPSHATSLPSSMPEPIRSSLLFVWGRFADGDSAVAAAAGAALERTIATPLPPDPNFINARYAAGQWALDRGQIGVVHKVIVDLKGIPTPPDSTWVREIPSAYAMLLEAQLAAKRRSPELPKLLARLDSTLINVTFNPFATVGNLILSRLYEAEGDLPRALVAIRRRIWDLTPSPIMVTYHREEGRLAALNGDREGAIRAYRRYLALRSGAEPRLQRQVAQVRTELEALQRESTDK